jgi:hypothetical protein
VTRLFKGPEWAKTRSLTNYGNESDTTCPHIDEQKAKQKDQKKKELEF